MTTLEFSVGRAPVAGQEALAAFVDAVQTCLHRLGAEATLMSTIPHGSLRLAVHTHDHSIHLDRLVGIHCLRGIRATSGRTRWTVSVAHIAARPPAHSLHDADLIVRFDRSGGPGGQNVNTRSTAVRLTHTPSGIQVRSTGQRSQAQNRAQAHTELTQRLVAHHQERIEAQSKAEWKSRRDPRGKAANTIWTLPVAYADIRRFLTTPADPTS